jgi:hypothetical protein
MPVNVVQAAAGGNANTDVGRLGGSSTLYFEESIRMVSAEALQENARLGIGRYQPRDIALASLRSASFPAHGEDEDNDGVEEDNDGDDEDAPPQTPASPARQIPMSFARLISPRNYNSQLSGVSALAAGASVILSSRQKE